MHDEIRSDMEELSSAEEFLDYFEIAYEPGVVQVNRLHILQRFHDYMETTDESSIAEGGFFAHYHQLLSDAYLDFVDSDARTEKVFKVFRMMEPRQAVVPLSNLLNGGLNATKV